MEEEKFFNDKQSKVKYIVIGVLLFFVLAIIGMVYYSLTPKVILSETIKSLESILFAWVCLFCAYILPIKRRFFADDK